MKEIEVQLSPFGEYPQTREDGTTVNQICDAEACQATGLDCHFGDGERSVGVG